MAAVVDTVLGLRERARTMKKWVDPVITRLVAVEDSALGDDGQWSDGTFPGYQSTEP